MTNLDKTSRDKLDLSKWRWVSAWEVYEHASYCPVVLNAQWTKSGEIASVQRDICTCGVKNDYR